MTTFTALVGALAATSVDTLEGFDKAVALDAGINPGWVHTWGQLHATYYGRTRFTRKQRDARRLARNACLTLDFLNMVERRLSAIEDEATRHTRRLEVLAMLAAAPCRTRKQLRRFLNEHLPATQRAPLPGVRFGRSIAGMRTMIVTASERELADLEHALLQLVDHTKPLAPQLLTHFLMLMRGDAAHSGVPLATPHPTLMIALEDWVSIHEGTGDEVVLGLTDGTTMTGAEYLAQFADEEHHLQAALFHPEHGAVNLYRTERFANAKQRTLAAMVNPVCPVPDCRRPADHNQAHHITAWHHGGETNLNNIAMLCSYHNGVNDDDPAHPSRGRVEMVRGTPTWHSPNGHPVPNPVHPYGAMQTLFG
ncbi:HNH endonuclease [Corynebacterium sp. TA-R-1]|uniref:HNH endonuclease n=1 Tax=Corynebacterium stercoris TaxID=2943490 RepID=A0ABT1G5S8_9CORY|nr:HNH endonuclease signature motif containing protein [Corynebacterium stercoris]MCP1388368.1 HNH endonuclease [Corynebacterium stercoris]